MPIFEYLCDDCGTKFEKLVRRTGEEIACPKCGESHLKQELSTFSAHSVSGGQKAQQQAPSCPGGMCRNPGMCGMN